MRAAPLCPAVCTLSLDSPRCVSGPSGSFQSQGDQPSGSPGQRGEGLQVNNHTQAHLSSDSHAHHAHTLTSHSALEIWGRVPRTLWLAESAARAVKPGGPGCQGRAAGSSCTRTEQFLHRTWGNRGRPSSTEASRLKAAPMGRPFLWKESSTAASVEKDCLTHTYTVEIQPHVFTTRKYS